MRPLVLALSSPVFETWPRLSIWWQYFLFWMNHAYNCFFFFCWIYFSFVKCNFWFFPCSTYLLTPRTVTCGTPLTFVKVFRVSPSCSSPQTYCCTVRGLTWSLVMTVLTPINRYDHRCFPSVLCYFVYLGSSFNKMNGTAISAFSYLWRLPFWILH